MVITIIMDKFRRPNLISDIHNKVRDKTAIIDIRSPREYEAFSINHYHGVITFCNN